MEKKTELEAKKAKKKANNKRKDPIKEARVRLEKAEA